MRINKKLAEHILEMAEVDQGARFRAGEDEDKLSNYVVYIIDTIHNYRIRRIIEEYGYPTKKLVGKKSMNAFWLLVQHQDFDLNLQEDCLEKCDFDPKDKALLTDRVLVNNGKKQIYGTQFFRNNKGGFDPRPIKDRKNLDKLRKEVGLDSFADNYKRMNK